MAHNLATEQEVMQGVAGSYSNIGLWGPPLILAALGSGCQRAVVLIFVFDQSPAVLVIPV